VKSWKNRRTLFRHGVPQPEALVAAPAPTFASSESGRDLVPPEAVVDWLAQLTLLQGVPFEYLVPYEALLPPESLRFFYIDDNWLDRLVDGAISVGVASTQDNAFNQSWYEALYNNVAAARTEQRAKMRGKPAEAVTTSVISGFLFRSVVVSGWPGIEIRGTAKGTPLPILRMDRLSSSVLLCLFSGVPDEVQFIEPGEGLHFGLIDDSSHEHAPRSHVLIRGLGLPASDPLPPGEQVTKGGKNVTAPASFRAGTEEGVVEVADLQASIQQALESDQLPGGKVTPAAFAIELVRGAGKLNYNTPESETI